MISAVAARFRDCRGGWSEKNSPILHIKNPAPAAGRLVWRERGSVRADREERRAAEEPQSVSPRGYVCCGRQVCRTDMLQCTEIVSVAAGDGGASVRGDRQVLLGAAPRGPALPSGRA